MRRHNSFPGPGDRIRLAIPHPTDESSPHARYGTVTERSCGRSNALRVRWDHDESQSDLAPDAGVEGWLADAGWYWDKAHLEVVDASEAAPAAPAAEPGATPVSEEDAWLSAAPRAGTGPGSEGSLEAVAEWEAALASEVDSGTDRDWSRMLADALGNGAPVASRMPAGGRPPAVTASAIADVIPSAPPTPVLPAATDHGSKPGPAPAGDNAQRWAGDDILPNARKGGRRRGRR